MNVSDWHVYIADHRGTVFVKSIKIKVQSCSIAKFYCELKLSGDNAEDLSAQHCTKVSLSLQLNYTAVIGVLVRYVDLGELQT